MRFLPIFLDLHAGTVALVGSGSAALNKLRLLQAANADIRWYPLAASVPASDFARGNAGRVEIVSADPRDADFTRYIFVVSAAGGQLDEEIAARARRDNVPINVVDRPDLCSFIFPAIIDRGNVVVAVGTGGASPVLARRIRERIEAILPARIGELAALAARFRHAVTQAVSKTGQKDAVRRFWERVMDGPIAVAALAGHWPVAEAALARAIAEPQTTPAHPGTVFLVDAGPGDPDLLTLRALQVLQSADVIFYDHPVNDEILNRARRDAERVFVGAHYDRAAMGLDAINTSLAEAARAGKTVVRLAGRDPFVLGGGGELDYLRQAGIAAIVVPGVTNAVDGAGELAA